MDYGAVIKDAVSTFWKHKSLWVFGIVIAIFHQGDYGFGVSYRESFPSSPEGGMPPFFADIPGRDLILGFFDNPVPYVVAFGCLGLLLSAVTSFVGWLSKGALIGMVDEIDCSGATSVKGGWRIGKRRVIPLFLMSILLTLPSAILAVPAMVGGLWTTLQFSDLFRSYFTGDFPNLEEMVSLTDTVFLPGFACLFPLLCVGGLIGWFLGLLNSISARSCVLENLGVIASIRRGWQMLRTNIGYVLLTWFLLAILGALFGLCAAVPAMILWTPIARAVLHGTWTPSNTVGALIMAGYYVIVAFVAGGILTSFNSTLWTKLYKALLLRDASASGQEPAGQPELEPAQL